MITSSILSGVTCQLVSSGALGAIYFPGDDLIIGAYRDEAAGHGLIQEPTQETIDEAKRFLAGQQKDMVRGIGLFKDDAVFEPEGSSLPAALDYELEQIDLFNRALVSSEARVELLDLVDDYERYDLLEKAVDYCIQIAEQNPNAYKLLAFIVRADQPLGCVDKARQFLVRKITEEQSSEALRAIRENFEMRTGFIPAYLQSRQEYYAQTQSQYRVTDSLRPVWEGDEIARLAAQLFIQTAENRAQLFWIMNEGLLHRDIVCLMTLLLMAETGDLFVDIIVRQVKDPIKALVVLLALTSSHSLYEYKLEADQLRFEKKLSKTIVTAAIKDHKIMLVLAQFYLVNTDILSRTFIQNIIKQADLSDEEILSLLSENNVSSKIAFWLSVMGGQEMYERLYELQVFDMDLEAKRHFLNELDMLIQYDPELFFDQITRFVFVVSLKQKIEVLIALAVRQKEKIASHLAGFFALIEQDEGSMREVVDKIYLYLKTGRHRLLSLEDKEMLELFAYIALRDAAKFSNYAKAKLSNYQSNNSLKAAQFMALAAAFEVENKVPVDKRT